MLQNWRQQHHSLSHLQGSLISAQLGIVGSILLLCGTLHETSSSPCQDVSYFCQGLGVLVIRRNEKYKRKIKQREIKNIKYLLNGRKANDVTLVKAIYKAIS